MHILPACLSVYLFVSVSVYPVATRIPHSLYLSFLSLLFCLSRHFSLHHTHTPTHAYTRTHIPPHPSLIIYRHRSATSYEFCHVSYDRLFTSIAMSFHFRIFVCLPLPLCNMQRYLCTDDTVHEHVIVSRLLCLHRSWSICWLVFVLCFKLRRVMRTSSSFKLRALDPLYCPSSRLDHTAWVCMHISKYRIWVSFCHWDLLFLHFLWFYSSRLVSFQVSFFFLTSHPTGWIHGPRLRYWTLDTGYGIRNNSVYLSYIRQITVCDEESGITSARVTSRQPCSVHRTTLSIDTLWFLRRFDHTRVWFCNV